MLNETKISNVCVDCICLPICKCKEVYEFIDECSLIMSSVKDEGQKICVGTTQYIYFNGSEKELSFEKQLASSIYIGKLFDGCYVLDISLITDGSKYCLKREIILEPKDD